MGALSLRIVCGSLVAGVLLFRLLRSFGAGARCDTVAARFAVAGVLPANMHDAFVRTQKGIKLISNFGWGENKYSFCALATDRDKRAMFVVWQKQR